MANAFKNGTGMPHVLGSVPYRKLKLDDHRVLAQFYAKRKPRQKWHPVRRSLIILLAFSVCQQSWSSFVNYFAITIRPGSWAALGTCRESTWETPGSCMVTPYQIGADSMVEGLCVMISI